jgi:hypothetical protein
LSLRQNGVPFVRRTTVTRRRLVPTLLALAGLAAVLLAARTEVVALRPAYDGPIHAVQAGMGPRVGHEERLFAGITGLGTVGALLSAKDHRVALLAQAAGGIVLVFAANVVRFQLVGFDLYVGLPLLDGASGPVLLGPAAYLFVLGGVLLVAAGVAGYARDDATTDRTAPTNAGGRTT